MTWNSGDLMKGYLNVRALKGKVLVVVVGFVVGGWLWFVKYSSLLIAEEVDYRLQPKLHQLLCIS